MRAELVGDSLGALDVDVGERDRVAVRVEPPCDRLADPARLLP